MFSSDAASRPAARASRPAILAPGDAAAWVPEDMAPLSAFDLPEFDADELAPEQAPVRPAPRDPREQLLELLRAEAREQVEGELRAALAQRDAEEQAARERVQAEAFANGVALGRAEAEQAAHAAIASALQALYVATEEVRASESRWLATLQENMAALVAGAARHVVGREVRTDDALVRDLAARALAEFPQDQAVQLRLNPADVAAVKAALAESPRAGEVRFIAEPRVDRGGCMVEGRDRIVDGRVDTALERIYRRLSGHHA